MGKKRNDMAKKRKADDSVEDEDEDDGKPGKKRTIGQQPSSKCPRNAERAVSDVDVDESSNDDDDVAVHDDDDNDVPVPAEQTKGIIITNGMTEQELEEDKKRIPNAEKSVLWTRGEFDLDCSRGKLN